MDLIFKKFYLCNIVIKYNISMESDYRLAFIDTGMTASLSKNDHKYFLNLVQSILLRNPVSCARDVK